MTIYVLTMQNIIQNNNLSLAKNFGSKKLKDIRYRQLNGSSLNFLRQFPERIIIILPYTPYLSTLGHSRIPKYKIIKKRLQQPKIVVKSYYFFR
jgi:hypothetical protein